MRMSLEYVDSHRLRREDWPVGARRPGNGSPFEVGRPVDDLLLPRIDDGSALSVSAFRGDRLLLHLFASW